MIDKKKRLISALDKCDTFEQFYSAATSRSKWLLRPYVDVGHIITRAWLESVWTNSGRAL